MPSLDNFFITLVFKNDVHSLLLTDLNWLLESLPEKISGKETDNAPHKELRRTQF